MKAKLFSTTIAVLSILLVALFIPVDNTHEQHQAFAVSSTTQQENKPLAETNDGIKMELTSPKTIYASQLVPIEIKVRDSTSGSPISHVDWAISVKDPKTNVIHKTTTAHSHAGKMNFEVSFPTAGENVITLTASSLGLKMMGMDIPPMARTHIMKSGDLMKFENDPENDFGARSFEFPVYVMKQQETKTIEGTEPGKKINVHLATTEDEIIAGKPTTMILTVTQPNGEMLTHPDVLISVRKGSYKASDSAEPINPNMPMNGAFHGHTGVISYTTTFPSAGNYYLNADLNNLMVSNYMFGTAHTRFIVHVSDGNSEVSLTKASIPENTVNVVGLEAPFYTPQNTKVKTGTTLTFDNVDGNIHTVTSGNKDSGPDGAFDSGLMKPGEKFTVNIDKPGTYSYYCTIHPNMEGTLVVS